MKNAMLKSSYRALKKGKPGSFSTTVKAEDFNKYFYITLYEFAIREHWCQVLATSLLKPQTCFRGQIFFSSAVPIFL